MNLITIILFILIVLFFIVCNLNKNHKINSSDNIKTGKEGFDVKKLLYGIILFIPIFIAYYFLIAFVSLIPLFYIAGPEGGAWAYAIVLGFAGSLILTIITLIKILSKK